MIVSPCGRLGTALAVVVGWMVVLAPAGAASTTRIQILDFGYAPDEIIVAPGEAVVWSNQGATTHSVTPDGSESFGSGNLPPGKSHVSTFPRLGTYAFHCDFYPSMKGVVRVVEPASTTTTTTSPPARAPSGSAPKVPSTVGVIPQPPSTTSTASGTAAGGEAAQPSAQRQRAAEVYGTGLPRPRADLSALTPSTEAAEQPAASQAGPPPAAAAGTSAETAGDLPEGKKQNRPMALVGQVLFAAGAVLLLSGMRSRRKHRPISRRSP